MADGKIISLEYLSKRDITSSIHFTNYNKKRLSQKYFKINEIYNILPNKYEKAIYCISLSINFLLQQPLQVCGGYLKSIVKSIRYKYIAMNSIKHYILYIFIDKFFLGQSLTPFPELMVKHYQTASRIPDHF